jgi:galactoside O-acetyltransferase
VFIGANTWIDAYVMILAGPADRDRGSYNRKKEVDGVAEGEVRIGENCHIAPFTVLQGHGGILIKNDCGVASGCKIYSLSHHYNGTGPATDDRIYKFTPMAGKQEQSLISSPVIMENSTALGLNSVLLPGTHIGEGAWIGSGSVVRGHVPARSVWSILTEAACTPMHPRDNLAVSGDRERS